MEGAGDDGHGEALFVVGAKGFFDDGFSGAGLADEEGESMHLALREDDVEGALLLGEQCGCCFIEGVSLTPKYALIMMVEN